FLSGGGSCPADKYASIHGVSTMVWDWQRACGYISGPVRAVVLVLAALAAAFILIPGKGGDGP
ncbi:virulence factor TspB C-terminal domain-related protein, partial [Xylophilus ampelinus]